MFKELNKFSAFSASEVDKKEIVYLAISDKKPINRSNPSMQGFTLFSHIALLHMTNVVGV